MISFFKRFKFYIFLLVSLLYFTFLFSGCSLGAAAIASAVSGAGASAGALTIAGFSTVPIVAVIEKDSQFKLASIKKVYADSNEKAFSNGFVNLYYYYKDGSNWSVKLYGNVGSTDSNGIFSFSIPFSVISGKMIYLEFYKTIDNGKVVKERKAMYIPDDGNISKIDIKVEFFDTILWKLVNEAILSKGQDPSKVDFAKLRKLAIYIYNHDNLEQQFNDIAVDDNKLDEKLNPYYADIPPEINTPLQFFIYDQDFNFLGNIMQVSTTLYDTEPALNIGIRDSSTLTINTYLDTDYYVKKQYLTSGASSSLNLSPIASISINLQNFSSSDHYLFIGGLDTDYYPHIKINKILEGSYQQTADLYLPDGNQYFTYNCSQREDFAIVGGQYYSGSNYIYRFYFVDARDEANQIIQEISCSNCDYVSGEEINYSIIQTRMLKDYSKGSSYNFDFYILEKNNSTSEYNLRVFNIDYNGNTASPSVTATLNYSINLNDKIKDITLDLTIEKVYDFYAYIDPVGNKKIFFLIKAVNSSRAEMRGILCAKINPNTLDTKFFVVPLDNLDNYDFTTDDDLDLTVSPTGVLYISKENSSILKRYIIQGF